MFEKLGILTRFQDENQENEVNKKQTTEAKATTTENVEDRINDFSRKNKVEKNSSVSAVEDIQMLTESVINNNPRLHIYKPTHYEVVTSIGTDIVRDQKIVVLDMQTLDEKTSIKILQFVYGICFAMNISPEEISNKMYLIDPLNKASNFK